MKIVDAPKSPLEEFQVWAVLLWTIMITQALEFIKYVQI